MGKLWYAISLTWALLLLCLTQELTAVRDEESIISDLFATDATSTEGRRIVRPPGIGNSSAPVKVYLYYSLVAVNAFNEKTGYISVQVYEHMLWKDPRLSWNSTEYPDVQKLIVPAKYIWIPDVAVYTSGSKMLNNDWHEEKVIIFTNNEVQYVPIRIFNFRCNIDISEFPYDTQICRVALGSWVHHTDELEIVNSDTSSDFLENSHNDWNVQNHSFTSEMVFYPCCIEQYQTLTLTLVIARRPKFYFNIFIAPAVTMLFILPTIHLFPPGGTQKTTLAGLLLACCLLLHFMLYQQIGGFAEEKTPKLVEHYQSLMTMIVVSIGVSSLTSTLANAVHTSRRVPAAIRKVMNSVVGRICCFRSPDVKGEFTQLGQTLDMFHPEQEMSPIVDGTTADVDDQSQFDNSALHLLVDELRYGRERRQLEMEWYQLALFVDRLTVVMFIVYIFVGSAVIESH